MLKKFSVQIFRRVVVLVLDTHYTRSENETVRKKKREICECVHLLLAASLVAIFCSKMVIHVSRFIFNLNFSTGFLISSSLFYPFFSTLKHTFALSLPHSRCCFIACALVFCSLFLSAVRLFTVESCARVLCHLDVSVSVFFCFLQCLCFHRTNNRKILITFAWLTFSGFHFTLPSTN